jgi:curli production assembly/transport component CsgG
MKFIREAALARALGGIFGLALLSGCQSATLETPIAQPPILTPVTKPSYSLRTLPPPTSRIAVAVYDFPDLTGQFKELQNVQTLSKAVTQGGAPMLIKALQDAGERRWFTVLDRARLDDLLKERQIVTEMRRVYQNEQQISAAALPPLRHAGIILEGGIIGYDTNTMTGGLGARYLGIGGDTKWQQDTVTVTLRAVSTNTGEVLASVTVHKMIASTSLQGGAFRYVMLDKILEAEAGITQNEPKQIAVQEAIEKSVKSLIIEGADLGVWAFRDPAAGRKVIDAYMKEKYGEKITVAAETAPAPDTVNPTRVVETVPARPARVRVAAPPAATTPPPPAKDESVGSVTPPPGAPDEVVGQAKVKVVKPVRAAAEQHVEAISVALN